MEVKTNYFKLGLFVIAGMAFLVIILIALGAGRFTQEKVYFETYFDESVQGLSSGSAVHYRGFPIGKVESIEFVTQHYNLPKDSDLYTKYLKYVMVIVSVNAEQLATHGEKALGVMFDKIVGEGARIRLTQQPLTGISYLDIDFFDATQYPVLEPDWKPDYWYIPSAPSLLSTFTQSAEAAFKQLAHVDIAKLSRHADEMMIAVKESFDSANVSEIIDEAKAFLVEARQTNMQIQNLLGSGDPEVMATLPETIDRFDRTLSNIQMFLKTRSGDFSHIISNIKEVTDNLKDLTQELKQQPSKLLYSKPPKESEVLK